MVFDNVQVVCEQVKVVPREVHVILEQVKLVGNQLLELFGEVISNWTYFHNCLIENELLSFAYQHIKFIFKI